MAITFGGVLNTDYVLAESSSNAPDRDFTKPSGLSDGDVLAVEWNESAEGVTITPPSGWTERVNHNNTAGDAAVSTHMFTRVVTTASGEPATYEFTSSASVPFGGGIYRYSGVDNTTPIDAGPQTRDKNNSSTLDFTGITTVTDGAWLLSTAGLQPASSTHTATSPWSGPVRNTSVGQRGWFDHFEQASAGASGTVTWTFSVSNRDPVGYLIALRPATGGGGTVQGAATATQAQTATSIATVTALGAATTSQAQAATATATVTAQGVATASQAQAATAVATVTVQGAATASQAQAATSVATVAATGTATASQGQAATATATVTAQGAATASQEQTATSVGTVAGAAAQGEASASQGQTATATATVRVQGVVSASQDAIATTIATVIARAVGTATQAQSAVTTATVTARGTASSSQGQTAVSQAGRFDTPVPVSIPLSASDSTTITLTASEPAETLVGSATHD